jgi:cytochrome P450
MPEVWGTDAKVFNPDRWFTEAGEGISYSPFSKTTIPTIGPTRVIGQSNLPFAEYHSWNAGPRSCLGRALATYEGLAISTAILQRFDVVLVDHSRIYEPLAALNMVRRYSPVAK